MLDIREHRKTLLKDRYSRLRVILKDEDIPPSKAKYLMYLPKKQTEVDLLLHFCTRLKSLSPPIRQNTALMNLYNRQIDTIIKKVSVLHEDLQYDYGLEVNELRK